MSARLPQYIGRSTIRVRLAPNVFGCCIRNRARLGILSTHLVTVSLKIPCIFPAACCLLRPGSAVEVPVLFDGGAGEGLSLSANALVFAPSKRRAKCNNPYR
jgi:hypothetical protein